MERRLIRKRWQVTIPKAIRRYLGLYQGQLLNWQIVEGLEGGPLEVRVFPGSYHEKGESNGAREGLKMTKVEKLSRRKRIGISDVLISARGRDKLKAIIMEVVLDLGLGQDGNKDRAGHPPGPGDAELN